MLFEEKCEDLEGVTQIPQAEGQAGQEMNTREHLAENASTMQSTVYREGESQSGKAVWVLVAKCPESWEKERDFYPDSSGEALTVETGVTRSDVHGQNITLVTVYGG